MQETSATNQPNLYQVPPDSSANASFQSQMGHISRHALVFFLGTIFTAATGYLFKIYLARALGAEVLGIYALGMTLVGLFGVLNGMGIPQAAVRFVAAYFATGRTEDLRRFLSRGVLFLFLSNLLFSALLVLVGPWIAIRFYHSHALSGYFGLFASIMLFGALTTFLGQVLAGYKDVVRRTVITNFIGSPVMMVLTIGLVFLGFGFRGYLIAQVASAICVFVLLIFSVAKLTPAGRGYVASASLPLEKDVISFSAFAFMVSLAEFLMAQSDKMLIGFYLNPRDVGVYAVAMTLVAVVPIILQSVNQIFTPLIADLHERKDKAMLGRLFQTLTKWIFGLTLPLVAVMIVFAPVLMRIFGHDFIAGWPVLVIGTLGQLANCGSGSVGYLLQMSGHQQELLKVQTTMVFVMVALGVILIPRWGIVGAAMDTGIVSILSNLWYLFEARRKLGLWPYNLSYWKLLWPLASTVGVLLIERRLLYAFHMDAIVVGASLISGYLVFVAAAIVFGLNNDDRIILHAMWERTRGRFRLRGAGI